MPTEVDKLPLVDDIKSQPSRNNRPYLHLHPTRLSACLAYPVQQGIQVPPISSLADQLEQQLPANFWNRPVLVAVSGGSDSVGLLVLLTQIRQNLPSTTAPLHVAHFDHQWGDHSGETSRFVAELARENGAHFHLQTSETRQHRDGLKLQGSPPRLPALGPEATARQLRFRFFEEQAKQLSAGYLLTGHTLDDQAETILMRILRGTSIDGLAGIQSCRSLTANCRLLRPMLQMRRNVIQQYLSECRQMFVEDPSNEDLALTRNRIRSQVLPLLANVMGQEMTRPLARLSESAGDWKVIWEYLSAPLEEACLEQKPQRFCIQVRKLAGVPEPVVRQQLIRCWQQAELPQQEMNREHWMRLTRLAVRPSSETDETTSWPAEFHFPGPVLARRSAGILTVERMPHGQS